MSEESAIHRIAVLLLEPVVGFDATIPPLLFGQAVDDAGRSLYEVETVGLGPSPLQTTTAYQITPSADVSALATADTVIVPGTKLASCRIDGTIPDDLREALTLIRPRARVVSICTGAFVLAAGGYLDGRRATTHWRYADDFRRLYPRVDLDESVLFVDDGDVLSSAGLAAGIDLCLHIIRRDHGTAGGQRRCPALCGPSLARGRTGTVHRTSGPRRRGPDNRRDARVGSPPPRPEPLGQRTCTPRTDEPADLQPQIPRGDRRVAGRLGTGATSRPCSRTTRGR